MSDAKAANIRRTEVDGCEVTWQLAGHTARIMTVREDGVVLVSYEVSPDLAQARDGWPQLAGLWDAVRHELWSELVPAQQVSIGSRTSGRPWD
ncbi:hypothetical protein [Nocardia sp. BMG51109]|uniref:hypothetical protein n=1 Tax=Nocardia sp. BMG51109 TaxID=1056816 RepID=UPI000463A6D4|nr:hypothetical protein [Nocardia sp. BMG51109]